MLTIRKEQMQILGEYVLRQYKDRMARQLRTSFPNQVGTMAEAELRALIEAGIEKAARYGIITECGVETFLEYMATYSPDFDTNAETSWAGEILSGKDIDGSLKIERLKKAAPIKREV